MHTTAREVDPQHRLIASRWSREAEAINEQLGRRKRRPILVRHDTLDLGRCPPAPRTEGPEPARRRTIALVPSTLVQAITAVALRTVRQAGVAQPQAWRGGALSQDSSRGIGSPLVSE